MTIVLPPLHRAQHQIRLDPRRFRVVSAGRRFGKGILGVGESFRRGIAGAKCRWVSPSYASDSFQSGWSCAARLASQIPGVSVHLQRKQFDFSALGGGWLQFKTAEEPDGLRGESLDFVVFDEAAHIPDLEPTWEQCVRPSLMDRKGGAWFVSTPRGFNYFQKLFLRHRDEPDWASFQFPTGANPHIDPAEIEAMRRSLPALVARQEVDAEFVQLAGALFKREHFALAEELPACSRWVRSWDLAFTTKSSSDYSVGAKVGLAPDGRLCVADVVRLRAEWPQVIRVIADTARLDGPSVLQGVECVGAQVGALQTLTADPMLAGLSFRPVPVDKDKLTRALPLLTRAEQGKLVLRRAHWTQALVDELCAFDGTGKGHDDQVDALSGSLALLAGTSYYAVAV